MDFNLSFNDDPSWLYNDSNSNSYSNELLQEPVPFEDFKFSFGITPDFNATPTIGDFPPPLPLPPPIINSNAPTSLDPLFLQQEPFNFAAAAAATAGGGGVAPAIDTANSVLDEDDQKAFSNFLDAFFLDPDMQPNLSNDDQDEKEEENRRNSILQSLDEQKKLHQTLNLIASLPSTNNTTPSTTINLMTDSSLKPNNNKSNVTPTSEDNDTDSSQLQTIYLHLNDATNSSLYKYCHHQKKQDHQSSKKRPLPCAENSSSSSASSTTRNNKKPRTTKELLTEEEKRANHIASEQKRRSTIRNGFKELTDLVPTLKNINNSKSTVLFKAVDFIRYLERRNRYLRDKVGSLELRAEVEGRMTGSSNINSCTDFTQKQQPPKEVLPPPSPSSSSSSLSSSLSSSSLSQPTSSYSPIKHIVAYSPPNIPLSQTKKPMPSSSSLLPSPSSTMTTTPLPKTQCVTPLPPLIENHNKKMRNNSNTVDSTSHNSNMSNLIKGLPVNARNALLAHKTQQKQLLLLQEQLQMHQRLIAQQQEMKEKSLNQHRLRQQQQQPQQQPQQQQQHQKACSHSPKNKLPPILGQYDQSAAASILAELEDKAISAP